MGKQNSKVNAGFSEQLHLEAKQQRFAAVRNGRNVVCEQLQSAQLRALKKVTVYKTTDNPVQMAFSFPNGDGTCFLAVEDNTVKLKEKKEPTSECFLRWKSKIGEWGILESVKQPNNFLQIHNGRVTVSSTKSADCLFRFRSSLKLGGI